MRRLIWTFLIVALSTLGLGAETAPRTTHKRLHWLRRIGSAEVRLAERVSSIRLRGSYQDSVAQRPREESTREGAKSFTRANNK